MLVIIGLLLLALFMYRLGINRILGLPPGPPPLPLIGNMLSFSWDVDKLLLDWKARYGRVFTVWLPFPMVVIGDHKVLQEHIARNGDAFIAKKNSEELNNLMVGGPYGLVFEDNDIVKEQRKFALKTLHEVGFGSAALEDVVHNVALEAVARWREAGDAAVDVSENISKAIGNVVWRLTFGASLDFDNDIVPRFRKLQNEMGLLMGGPFMMFFEQFPFLLRNLDWFFGNHLKRLKAILDESIGIVKEAIEVTEKSYSPDDQAASYVEAFIRETKKLEESRKSIGNFHYQQMMASAIAIWGAGVDTTANTLRMCCLMLINHPEAQRKMQMEIDSVIGSRRIRLEDQKKLPYTCAFIQEIYRLGGVLHLNFLRKTTQKTNIEGFPIATGTTILPQFTMVHLDPNEFERPDYFCPERHIDEQGLFVKDPRITPFSIGKRACLGETLARMEIFVLFATFIQQCHFTPVGKVPPPITFTTGFGRFVHPFTVKIEPRN